jgi:hypothetical protein
MVKNFENSVLSTTRAKIMKHGGKTSTRKKIQHSECYLTIDRTGAIKADRMLRLDFAGFETWKYEFLDGDFRVRRVYPNRGGSTKLPIDQRVLRSLRKKLDALSIDLFHASKHEAGHAVLCYALRLCPVLFVNLRPSIIPHGNLYAQLENREPLTLGISRGSTSIDMSAQNMETLCDVQILKIACQALGGIAGGGGDETNAAGDIRRFDELISHALKSNHDLTGEFDLTRRRLRAELQILANEIITDRIVVPRHEALAETLFENEYLERRAVENALVPTSLPDYSRRIQEIGKKFAIPLVQREYGSWKIISISDPEERDSVENSLRDAFLPGTSETL